MSLLDEEDQASVDALVRAFAADSPRTLSVRVSRAAAATRGGGR